MRGPFPSAGRTVELLMLRSLPSGDYAVPLFIGDKQGLSQKQTVHVRVCSCAGALTCVAGASVAGAGLPVEVLAPLGAVFTALAGQRSAGAALGTRSSPQAVSQGHGVLWG